MGIYNVAVDSILLSFAVDLERAKHGEATHYSTSLQQLIAATEQPESATRAVGKYAYGRAPDEGAAGPAASSSSRLPRWPKSPIRTRVGDGRMHGGLSDGEASSSRRPSMVHVEMA